MMPRGRWPTLTVLTTSSLVLSMMLTVLSFSLVTKTVKALAAVGLSEPGRQHH